MKPFLSFIFIALSVFCTNSFSQINVAQFEKGQTQNRVHLAIIGDGYTEDDLVNLYAPKVDQTLEYMFNHPIKVDPYPRYKNFINVYRVDIPSQDSGVDELSQNIYRNTALGGEDGCTNWQVGICGVNWSDTHDAFENAATMFGFNPDWYLVLLNNDKYNAAAHWASRGALPVYSAHYEGHWDMRDIALHEGAHAWHKLADEYAYNDVAHQIYNGAEPSEVNVTTNPNGDKWAHWLGYVMPSGLEVGVFEGARYFQTGMYRPSRSSKMNGGPDDCHYLGNDCAHNMIGIEKIIHDIYEIVNPIDDHADNQQALINPEELWVKTVDPQVLMVDWIVNGKTVVSKGSETFSVLDYISETGNYSVTARAWDEVIEQSFSDNKNPYALDWVRRDLEKLEQSITWNIVVPEQAASYQKRDGTVVDSILDTSGSTHSYNGNNLEPYANLANADLADADLEGANLTNVKLSDANLNYADLTNANLANTDLTDATLTGVRSGGNSGSPYALPTNWQLTQGYLLGPYAYLWEANLSNADLEGANLTNANLTDAKLTDAKLTNANLTNADLTDANLDSAVLTDANVYNANLTDANLNYANVTNADLTNANLTDADLYGATLTYANLYGADLTAVNSVEYTMGIPYYYGNTVLPAGFDPVAHDWTLAPYCDITPDAVCDLADINQMFDAGDLVAGVVISESTQRFDLVDNDIIDAADITEWLSQAASEWNI